MIDLAYEIGYYAEATARTARITAALQRDDVREALARVPDGGTLSAYADPDRVVVTAYVNIDDPAIADIADGCDGRNYSLVTHQDVLDTKDVCVRVEISGRWRLTEGERETLRGIGKLKTETEQREYLACAA